MNPTPNPSRDADASIDPELAAAVRDWRPKAGSRPSVEIEPRADGQRIKMSYLGVETGVLFAWSAPVTRPAVQGTLDQLFGVLSWRVTGPDR